MQECGHARPPVIMDINCRIIQTKQLGLEFSLWFYCGFYIFTFLNCHCSVLEYTHYAYYKQTSSKYIYWEIIIQIVFAKGNKKKGIIERAQCL